MNIQINNILTDVSCLVDFAEGRFPSMTGLSDIAPAL